MISEPSSTVFTLEEKIKDLEDRVRVLDLENRRLKNRIKRAIEGFDTARKWHSSAVMILEIGGKEEGR